MYEDAKLALQHDFLEVVFADELNAFRAITLATPHRKLSEATSACQAELHACGRASRIEFDPKKESTHVVSQHCSEGFKILDINVDSRLTMNDAIIDIIGKIRWRVKAITRAQRFHSVIVMINLNKAKVLSYAKKKVCSNLRKRYQLNQLSSLQDIAK